MSHYCRLYLRFTLLFHCWPRKCRFPFTAFLLLLLLICCFAFFLYHLRSRSSKYSEDEGVRAKILEIIRNQNKSRMRLEDLRIVAEENSEQLPGSSHFNTVGSLDSICEGNDSIRCVVPFRNLETRLRFAPKYRLVACIIQKSMSTLLQAIMCLLYDEQRFIGSGRNIRNEYNNIRLCKNQNELNQLSRLRTALTQKYGMKLESFSYLAIVRDPVERFLSGFVDKCVRQPHSRDFCLGCQSNLTCFVMREYARMMSEAGRLQMAKTFEDMHFFPQNWRCNFRAMLANYTLIPVPSHPSVPSNSTLSSLLADFFRKLEVAENVIRLVAQQMDTQGGLHEERRTLHATKGTPVHRFFEQRLTRSPFLMEFVVRMFYHDFRIFGFPIPKMHFE